MAKKKKKRMSKEELRAPDAFEKKAEAVWKKIEPHKRAIGVVIVLLAVASVAWNIYGSSQRGAVEERAGVLSKALHPLTAAIWDPDVDGKEQPDGTKPTPPSGELFKTEADARKAAAERLGAYLSENADSPGANAVALGTAGLKVADDPKAAAAELDAWIRTNGEHETANLVRIVAGRAHAAAGDKESARGHFEAVSKEGLGWMKATALNGIGDLDNPLMSAKSGSGDAAAAKKSYEEAMTFLGDGDELNSAGLKREIETKLAALP